MCIVEVYWFQLCSGGCFSLFIVIKREVDFLFFYFLACIHNVTSMTFAQCSCGISRNAVCDACKTFLVRVLTKTFQAVFKSDFIGEAIHVLIMRVIIELLIHFKMAFKITAWISFQGGY